MAALAAITDYEAITGKTLETAEFTRIERLLGIASAAVLVAAHGQLVVQSTSTEVLRSVDGHIRFPQRPVTNVDAVVVAGVTLTADIDYRWTEGGDGSHAYLIRRRSGCDVLWGDVEVTVTYTHGWATVPDLIVKAVVDMVDGYLSRPADPVTSITETTGPFQYQRTYASARGVDEVPGPVRSMLEDLCGAPGPTSAPIRRGP